MGPAEPQIGAVAIVNQSSEAKPPKIPANIGNIWENDGKYGGLLGNGWFMDDSSKKNMVGR